MLNKIFKNKFQFGILFLFVFLAVFAFYSVSAKAFDCADISSYHDYFCTYTNGCILPSGGACSGSTDLTCDRIEEVNSSSMGTGEICRNAGFMSNYSLDCWWDASSSSCTNFTGGGGQGGNMTGFDDPCWAFTTNATCSAKSPEGCYWTYDPWATGGYQCMFMCADPANETIVAQANCTASASFMGMGCNWVTDSTLAGNDTGSQTTPGMCKWSYGGGGGGGGATPSSGYGCPQFDSTSQTQCESNNLGLSCTWTAGMNLCDPATTGSGGWQDCNSWCAICGDQTSCQNSYAMCEWNNGGNFCQNKVFMSGMGGDWNTSCYSAWDSISCGNSSANCTWVTDTFSMSGGHCDPAAYAETFNCSQNAVACSTPEACNTSDISGGAYWNSTWYMCIANDSTPEICFLPGDEDEDGKINCADDDCYTDPSCGFGMGMGGGGGGYGVSTMGLGAIDTELCYQHDENRGGSQSNCESQQGPAGSDMASTAICYWNMMPWSEGLCDPMFNQQMKAGGGMPTMMGGPNSIGTDPTNTSQQAWIDIVAMGVMDTPQSLDIGIPVRDITNLASCGKVLNSTTNQTGKYYRYLDTDGSITGGCTGIGDGSNYTGFEYRLNFESAGNYSNENKTAYRCVNSEWVPFAATMTIFKEMCYADPFMTQMGYGGVQTMTIKKSDIGSPTGNIRILTATANSSTDYTNPVDSAGPYYYTAGAMDFMPDNCFMDPTKCSVAFQPPVGGIGGFMMFEDCGPMAKQKAWDMDKDGLFGCDDIDCSFEPWCIGQSNYSAASDNTFPQVIMSKTDKFADSTMVTWHTDEPTTGMVLFYGTNTSCLNQLVNVSQLDDPNFAFDDYTSFHDVWFDNTTLDKSNTGAGLERNSTYYYKLRSCDQATPTAHCSVSGCLNFTTTTSNPTFKFKFDFTPPAGASANDFMGGMGYFFDTGSGYQNVNFNNVKSMNKSSNVTIKLKNPNLAGTGKDWEIELLEAKLTTNKNLNFSGLVSVQNRSDTGCSGCTYVGMTNKSFWDEIHQGLNVQKVNVTIPGKNPTNTVYKCTDYLYNSTNCQNITSNISCTFGNDSTECTMPAKLGFSAYVSPTITSLDSGDGGTPSGGTTGGGGVGGGAGNLFVLSESITEKTFTISAGDKIQVDFGTPAGEEENEKYTISVTEITGTTIVFDIK